MKQTIKNAGPSMIFVTGASRSGTTLLSQSLGRHSQVAGMREMQYFGGSWSPHGNNRRMKASEARLAVQSLFRRNGLIPAAGERQTHTADIEQVLAGLADEPGSCEVFAATANFFAARAGKHIPCEQTPRNIYYARTLLTEFPNSRVIHIVRDPRPVLASQKTRWRKRALLKDPSHMSRLMQLRALFNYHPYSIARLWNRATSDALRLQDHPRFRMLKFESLIDSPEQEIRGLCTFLGLDYEPAMLDVEHVNSSHVASTGHRTGFSREPIDAWRAVLAPGEIAAVTERCSDLMARVGYPIDSVALSPRARCMLMLRYAAHALGALALNPRRLWIHARAAHDTESSETPHAMTGVSLGRELRSQADVPSQRSTPPWKSVFGLPFMDVPIETAADHLVTRAQFGPSCRVVFINAHCLNVSVADTDLQDALQKADIVFADGIGMLIASILQRNRLENNVNGTDLFPPLCEHAAAAGVRLGFLGAAPGVVDRCVDVLSRTAPGLQISYTHHGYFGTEEDADIIEKINASGAQILLVAMGVPLQDLWIRKHSSQLTVPVVIGVGALLDFVSGGVRRAPSTLRSLKLEWLFRLGLEPRRLFSRYILGNPVFLFRSVRYSLTGILWGHVHSDRGRTPS